MSASALHVLRGGGERTRRSLLDPTDPRGGELITLPYYFFAVAHARGWTLVDCGVHPGLVADPHAWFGAELDRDELPDLRVAPDESVAGQLARLGVAPEHVGHVVLTHMHYDHCGGLGLLPGATVHVQRAERAFAQAPPPSQASSYAATDWAGELDWHEYDGELDLFGDGAIVAFPTPGHTPGHQSIELDLDAGCAILVGDAAYEPESMRRRRLPGFVWSAEAIVASWDEVEQRRRRRDATLVFSHHPSPDALAPVAEPWRP